MHRKRERKIIAENIIFSEFNLVSDIYRSFVKSNAPFIFT
ncbi:hypothetical protein EDF78_102580 [Rahnella sp. BIGb0236]|nr:hypothetical protein EDF78_102580 [Rahnella sp. BIGb0236]